MFGLALAIHQPVVGLTKRIAVWCTWPWLLLQSPWDLRFADRNFKQLVVVSLGSTLSTTPNARLATHIKTMRSITNTTIHATCCYSHTQRSPFHHEGHTSPDFWGLGSNTSAYAWWNLSTFSSFMCPAMSRLQEVLLYFSGLLRYLHISNSVNPVRIKNEQHAPQFGGWQLDFFSDRAFYNQDCLPSTNPPPKTNNLLRLSEIRPYIYYDIWLYIYNIYICISASSMTYLLGYKTKTNNNIWSIGRCSFINHRDLHWTSRTTSLRLGGHAFQVFLG